MHTICFIIHFVYLLISLPILVVVVKWSGLSICSQLSTYIDLCHCVYALDQLLFTIHKIPAKKKEKKKDEHLHNVVECPLTQMRIQGSCFQINTYCLKLKLNGKQCFLLYPLAVLLILFGLVLFFYYIYIFFSFDYRFCLFPLHLPMYFPTSGWKINSVLSVSSCVTSYSLQWVLKINSISVLPVLPAFLSSLCFPPKPWMPWHTFCVFDLKSPSLSFLV